MEKNFKSKIPIRIRTDQICYKCKCTGGCTPECELVNKTQDTPPSPKPLVCACSSTSAAASRNCRNSNISVRLCKVCKCRHPCNEKCEAKKCISQARCNRSSSIRMTKSISNRSACKERSVCSFKMRIEYERKATPQLQLVDAQDYDEVQVISKQVPAVMFASSPQICDPCDCVGECPSACESAKREFFDRLRRLRDSDDEPAADDTNEEISEIPHAETPDEKMAEEVAKEVGDGKVTETHDNEASSPTEKQNGEAKCEEKPETQACDLPNLDYSTFDNDSLVSDVEREEQEQGTSDLDVPAVEVDMVQSMPAPPTKLPSLPVELPLEASQMSASASCDQPPEDTTATATITDDADVQNNTLGDETTPEPETDTITATQTAEATATPTPTGTITGATGTGTGTPTSPDEDLESDEKKVETILMPPAMEEKACEVCECVPTTFCKPICQERLAIQQHMKTVEQNTTRLKFNPLVPCEPCKCETPKKCNQACMTKHGYGRKSSTDSVDKAKVGGKRSFGTGCPPKCRRYADLMRIGAIKQTQQQTERTASAIKTQASIGTLPEICSACRRDDMSRSAQVRKSLFTRRRNYTMVTNAVCNCGPSTTSTKAPPSSDTFSCASECKCEAAQYKKDAAVCSEPCDCIKKPPQDPPKCTCIDPTPLSQAQAQPAPPPSDTACNHCIALQGDMGNNVEMTCTCSVMCLHNGEETDANELDSEISSCVCNSDARPDVNDDAFELSRIMDEIGCACEKAESLRAPFIKRASFMQTNKAALQDTITRLCEKCRLKDQYIDSMIVDLKHRTNSGIFEHLLRDLACSDRPVPDFDRTQIANALVRPSLPSYCHCMHTSSPPHITAAPSKSVAAPPQSCFQPTPPAPIFPQTPQPPPTATPPPPPPNSKSSFYNYYASKQSSHLPPQPASVPTSPRYSRAVDMYDNSLNNSSVNTYPFKICNVKRISHCSILVRWIPPCNNLIIGYELYINGQLKSIIYDRKRTGTVIDAISLTHTLQIDIYAMTRNGRCIPPAVAIYEI